MDIKKIWKKSWQHLVALLIFGVLTCVYFAPVVFEDKKLPQGDVIATQGMGRDAAVYHETTGDWSYWSNSMFGGMPHNYTYPLPTHNVFRRVANVLTLGSTRMSLDLLWIYLLGFYVLMIALGCNPWLAIVGAIAFAMGSYNIIIIGAGHIGKARVIATIPVIIAGVMWMYRKRYIIGTIVTMLAVGLNVYWNHQQISYYLLIMLVCLAVAYFIHALYHKQVKDFMLASVFLLVSAVIATLPAVDRLVPTMDYMKETMRGGAVLHAEGEVKEKQGGLGRDYAFQWSYGKAETMTLLIPNFYGGSSHYPIGEDSETYRAIKQYAGEKSAHRFVKNAPLYWGRQPFTSGPVYAGAIICFLFLLGLMVVEGKDGWWLVAAWLIGIMMSWGYNLPWFNNVLFDYLPLYNKFRTPSMALVITTTAMVILGMMALKRIMNREVKLSHIYIAAGISGGLCLLFALAPELSGNFIAYSDAHMPEWILGAFDADSRAMLESGAQMPKWVLGAFEADRHAMLQSDAWRSFIYIMLGFGVLWSYLRFPKMKQGLTIALLGVLILSDMWMVDKRFLNDSHFVSKQQLNEPTEANLQIQQDTDSDYRVLNLASNTFNESQTSYFHKSIGGYSPVKLRRYQDIIDCYMVNPLNMNVINMLNTRYIITKEGVQYNSEAMGNAWFVQNIQWVNNPNEEINAIGNADLKNIAIIDTCWMKQIKQQSFSNTDASVALVNYNPSHLVYQTNNPANGLVVFSEVYYKTWKAYIDGFEVPLIRTNYILRGVEVPAGRHQIELRCVDELYDKTHTWSLIASTLVVVIILSLLGMAVCMNHRKQELQA